MAKPRAADRAHRATIGELATRTQLETLAAGRETVQRSSVRWRRVTDGDPCGWCAMLASRGPVYESKADAERVAGRGRSVESMYRTDGSRKRGGIAKGVKARNARQLGEKYHGHCGCTAEPYDGDPMEWEPTPDEQRFIDAYEAVHEPGMTGERIAALMDEWMKANPYKAAAGLLPVDRLIRAIEGRGEAVGFDLDGLDPRAVDETASTLAGLLEKYPGVNLSVIIHDTSESFVDAFGYPEGADALAFCKCQPAGISLHFRGSAHRSWQEAADAARRAYSPEVTQAWTMASPDAPLASTAIHEFGHALEYTHQVELAPLRLAQKASDLGWSVADMPRCTGRAFPEWCLEQGVDDWEGMESMLTMAGLSRYGATSAPEAFAEAFTDWTLNGDSAGPFGRWIGQKIVGSGIMIP